MGAGESKPKLSEGEKILDKIVSTDPIDPEDSFWGASIDNLDSHFAHLDPEEIPRLFEDATQKLARNCHVTGNFRCIVALAVSGLEQIPREGIIEINEWMLNLLFLTRTFMQNFISNFSYENRLKLINLPGGRAGEITSSVPSESIAIQVSSSSSSSQPQPQSSSSASSSRPNKPSRSRNDLTVRQLASHPELPSLLLKALVHAAVEIPLEPNTHELHSEIIQTLVVLFSTQMYGPLQEDYENPYLARAMGVGKEALSVSELSGLMRRLLRNFTERLAAVPPPSSDNLADPPLPSPLLPPDEQGPAEGGSSSDSAHPRRQQQQSNIFFRLGSSIVSLFYLPMHVYKFLFPPEPSNHPLADRSALLFLLLARQSHLLYQLEEEATPQRPGAATNVATLVASFVDAEQEEQALTYPDATVPFGKLYDAIASALPSEWATLLLYTLLHGNPQFRELVYSKSDLDVILVPLLELLYSQTLTRDLSASAGASAADDHLSPLLNTQRTYMVMILLLILSQDVELGRNLHRRLFLKKVDWYKEATLTKISLGSLMMIVLLRVLQVNLTSKHRDSYLHTNTLAALANIGSTCAGIHPYCAARLANMLEFLARKTQRLDQQVQQAGGAAKHELLDELNSFKDFARQILEIVNGCVSYSVGGRGSVGSAQGGAAGGGAHVAHRARTGVTENSSLVHWLLLKKNYLLAFKFDSRLWLIAENLLSLVSHLDKALGIELTATPPPELTDSTPSATPGTPGTPTAPPQSQMPVLSEDKIIKVIMEAGRKWRSRDDVAPATKFTYEEQEEAEEFFLPYIWRILYHFDIVGWGPQGITLFDTNEGVVTQVDGEGGVDLGEQEPHDDHHGHNHDHDQHDGHGHSGHEGRKGRHGQHGDYASEEDAVQQPDSALHIVVDNNAHTPK